MKKKIKSALSFYTYICKEDPANTVRYSNALIANIKRIVDVRH